AGLPPQDARFAAQRAFGNVALALEDSRAEWRFAWLGSLAQDLRYALRGFRKSPGFALTVTGTLALGLGTLATAFSMFNATVLRPYAVRDPYSLYSFLWRGRNAVHYGSWQDFSELRKQRTVFSEILAYYPGNASIAGRPLRVVAVSGNYFDMLGGQPCLGRVLGNADERPGTAVAVASYAAWKGRLHGDPGAIGRTSYVESVPWSAGYDLAEVVLACRSKHKSTILFDCAKFGVYNWECCPTRAFAPSLNWSPNKNSLRAMFPPSSARLNSACGRNGWRESTTSSA